MAVHQCPRCRASNVHRSRHRSRKEALVARLGRGLFRCHACNFRYARLAGAPVGLERLQRAARTLSTVACLTLAALAVIAAIVWLGRMADRAVAAAWVERL